MHPDNLDSNGAGYGADALPFKDMPEHAGQLDFEVQGNTVVLLGSRSRSSGVKAFPRREVCPQTGARDMDSITVGPRGTLYSWSTVHISATRPTPYTIGYVDFPEGVRVLAPIKLSDTELANLGCDTPVQLRADGDTWYVAPIPTQGAAV